MAKQKERQREKKRYTAVKLKKEKNVCKLNQNNDICKVLYFHEQYKKMLFIHFSALRKVNNLIRFPTKAVQNKRSARNGILLINKKRARSIRPRASQSGFNGRSISTNYVERSTDNY